MYVQLWGQLIFSEWMRDIFVYEKIFKMAPPWLFIWNPLLPYTRFALCLSFARFAHCHCLLFLRAMHVLWLFGCLSACGCVCAIRSVQVFQTKGKVHRTNHLCGKFEEFSIKMKDFATWKIKSFYSQKLLACNYSHFTKCKWVLEDSMWYATGCK